MICLNSLIEPTTRASTTFLQVGASTPVVRSCDVVRIGGGLRLNVLKAAEMAAPDVALVGRDAADVIGILRHEIGVEIAPSACAHFAGMFLIDAEHDRLGEAVGLLQELGQMPSNRFGAGSKRDDTLEILGLIFVVGNGAPIAIKLVLAGSPSGGIPFA